MDPGGRSGISLQCYRSFPFSGACASHERALRVGACRVHFRLTERHNRRGFGHQCPGSVRGGVSAKTAKTEDVQVRSDAEVSVSVSVGHLAFPRSHDMVATALQFGMVKPVWTMRESTPIWWSVAKRLEIHPTRLELGTEESIVRASAGPYYTSRRSESKRSFRNDASGIAESVLSRTVGSPTLPRQSDEAGACMKGPENCELCPSTRAGVGPFACRLCWLRPSSELGCIRKQPNADDKPHLRLNTGMNPIEN